MTSPPFELPLRAGDAASLADLIMQMVENRRVQDDLRNRLAARGTSLNLGSIRPYWGSFQQDPVHANAFYLAVDGLTGTRPVSPLLLRIALASAPASGLFPASFLVGRMRPGAGTRELVVNAVPFGPGDTEAIETFASKVDRTFLPRPQGSAPSITCVCLRPETDAPALFEGFRQVLKSTGTNAASFAAGPGTSGRALAAAIWSAIRAGWRSGYNVEAEPLDPASPEIDETIKAQAGFTRFRVPIAAAGESATAAAVAPDVADWALEEFGRRFAIGDRKVTFNPEEVAALTARFGPGLQQVSDAHDKIRTARVEAGLGRAFDLEVIPPATGAGEKPLLFCLHWLKAQGRPAQQVAVEPADPHQARELAAVARHSGATLSFDASVLGRLPNVAQWTGGRWNCRITEEVSADRVLAVAAALRA